MGARVAAKLTEETWSLSVRADPAVDPPHVKVPATATSLTLNLEDLRALGQKHGVKVIKAIQCLNVDAPLGQGLWEGVPLATVLRACGMENVRRVNYWGYHNNDPTQVFRSSLSYTEVMEPAVGDPPVFLAYSLNGEPLGLERGGPVRMIVPHAHGFKSVKWLQHITLTNDYRASDTYASLDDVGNDPSSHLKTYTIVDDPRHTMGARTSAPIASSRQEKVIAEFEATAAPDVIPVGHDVILSGVVMNGRTPVSHVEYWVRSVPAGSGISELRDDSPELLRAPWQRCDIQTEPADWSAALPPGTSPQSVFGIDATGRAQRWPLPYTYVGWEVKISGLTAGDYEIRARSVDVNGFAQPEPRPVQKTGRNSIGCRRVKIV